MESNVLRGKIKRKFVFLISRPFIFIKRIWYGKYYGRKIRKIINNHSKDLGITPGDVGSASIFVSAALRENSPVRQNILSVSVARSLGGLSDSNSRIDVSDASPDQYLSGNKAIFASIPGLKMDYHASSLKLPAAILDILARAQEENFFMFFDDQPVIGLTPEFLNSSCRLLADFKGTVDLIYISDAPRQIVNHVDKTLTVSMSDLDFRLRGVTPLATVVYGNYSYAVIQNPQTGFFFNTLIAPTADYHRRLKWYMNNISEVDSSLIEIVGSEYRGPVYHFFAVPLGVFQINIDFSHTENSVRNYPTAVTEEVYKALKNNYKVIVKT